MGRSSAAFREFSSPTVHSREESGGSLRWRQFDGHFECLGFVGEALGRVSQILAILLGIELVHGSSAQAVPISYLASQA